MHRITPCVASPPSGGYAPEHVNVRRQRNDDDSLPQFVRQLTSHYRTSPEIGWGQFETIEHDGPGVLVHGIRSELGRMAALHNFTDVPVRLHAELGALDEGTILVDLYGPGRIDLDSKGRVELEFAPFGYLWLRPAPHGDTRIG